MMSPRRLFLFGFLFCLMMLGIAGYFQFSSDLEPCPLCILQRVVTLALGIVFLLAALQNLKGFGIRFYGFILTFIGAIGVAIAGRHVWLQSLPADQVPTCGPGLNFMLDNFPLSDTINMVLRGSGECAEVLWTLMGVSIPGWTLLAFILLTLIGLVQLFRKPQRSQSSLYGDL